MGWNPELNAINNHETYKKRGNAIERGSQTLLKRYDRIHEQVLAAAIKPEDFVDLYGPENVARDIRRVDELRQKFSFQQSEKLTGTDLTLGDVRKLAEILEALIVSGINGYNWMPHCQAIKTSEYDDYVNGIDAVVEYSKPQQFGHLGLGIDVTFSQNLLSKFERIKNEIDVYDGDQNRLGEVKYFDSKRSGIHGSLYGLPRVVAALDIAVMEDLFSKGVSRENHVAKHALLIEMRHQLEVFSDYADKHNKACSDQFVRALQFVQTIIEEMDAERILQQSEYSKNRGVQEAIDQGLAIFD